MSGTAAGFNSYRFYSPIVLKKKAAKKSNVYLVILFFFNFLNFNIKS